MNQNTVKPQGRPKNQAVAIKDKKVFGIGLAFLEVMIILFYAFFLRFQNLPRENGGTFDRNQNEVTKFYPLYQDVNVMMLIGFGFLMTFIQSYSWSALAYTFFMNSIVVQLYILLSAFWERVFHQDNETYWGSHILINERTLTASSYCVASILIAFGAVLGRLKAFELLLMVVIQTIGYTLNEAIVYTILEIQDVGGSTAIHTFGAYFGLTISLIVGVKGDPYAKVKTSYNSNIFAFIGTLFLWMFWPSFNAGFFAHTGLQSRIIIINTVLSLTGSCLATFMITTFIKDRFHIEQILNATLAGGVIIGASAGLITNPAASLVLGIIGGIISSLGFFYLSQFLYKKIGLYDTCGVHNLHGIPGLLGGLASGVIVAAYGSDPINDTLFTNQLFFYSQTPASRDFNAQGGAQISSTFVSLGIAIFFGIITGALIKFISNLRGEDKVFEDKNDFVMPDEQQNPQAKKVRYNDIFIMPSSTNLNSKSKIEENKDIQQI